MFMIERLFGTGIFCVALLLFHVLLSETKISYKLLFRGYVIVLTLIGFFYVPPETADLAKTLEHIRFFGTLSFSSFYKEYIVTSSVPIARIYYWIIGKIGIYSLLPAITCLITYMCIFYIIIRTAQRYGLGRKSMANAVFFVMSVGSYMMVVSNIRTMLAVSMICYCIFREFVERKFKVYHIALYMGAAFIHNIAWVLIVMRSALFVFSRRQNATFKFFAMGFFAFVALILITYFDEMTDQIVGKGAYYIMEESYSYIWEYIIAGITVVVLLYIMSHYKKSGRLYINEMSEMLILVKLNCAVAIIFCFIFSMFYRFIVLIAPIFAIPVLMVELEGRAGGLMQKRSVRFQNMIFIATVILLFLNCARGSLCSLKFFVL